MFYRIFENFNYLNIAETFFSLTAVFTIGQSFRYIVYLPLQRFIQNQTIGQQKLYEELILGKPQQVSVDTSFPLPALAWILGILIALLSVFAIWLYNYIQREDGDFKKIYIFIAVLNIFWWAFLFPEISMEPFFGQLNSTIVNIIKLSFF